MIAFIAKKVSAADLPGLNSRVVILAEGLGGNDASLQISRALTDTQQDRDLGQDTYALSTQTGATVYGGVHSFSLDGSTLTMRLEPEAVDALGVPEEFSIGLEADTATIEAVRTTLRAMLGDESSGS